VNVGVGEHIVVTGILPGHGAPAPVGPCIISGSTVTVSPHAGLTTGYRYTQSESPVDSPGQPSGLPRSGS